MVLAPDQAFEARLAVRIGRGIAEQADEGGVGGADQALRIDRGDGDRRRVEQPCESELGGAGGFGLAGGAAEHERMRERAGADARQTVQDANGQAGAVGLDEVDVEAARAALRAAAAGARDQRRAVGRHDLRQLEPRIGDLGEVEAEPLGERRVEIFDIAVGVGGEEAGRRTVEIGDRRLHLGEARLLAGAVEGDLIDLPHGERALAAGARVWRHRLDRDAEPARRNGAILLALSRRRQAELLFQAAALLRRAGETKDRLGEMRVAAEGAVGRRHGGFSVEAEQRAIGLVGVEHAPRAVGDQGALRQIVDECLGDVVAGMALAEIEDADRAREQAKHADHRERGEDRQHERLGHLARHHGEPDGGDGQSEREHHDEANAPVARGNLRGGLGIAHRRIDIAHGRQITRFDWS